VTVAEASLFLKPTTDCSDLFWRWAGGLQEHLTFANIGVSEEDSYTV